jgi:MFS family permease
MAFSTYVQAEASIHLKYADTKQYAPMLFQQAGISSVQATFFASGVSAILIFVSTIPAFLLADKWGRRASTIYGGFVLSGCMLLIGSLYASDSVHATYGAGRWVVIVAIYIFALGYSTSKASVMLKSSMRTFTDIRAAWAVGVKLYASEIQPISTRATATALSQSANCVGHYFHLHLSCAS